MPPRLGRGAERDDNLPGVVPGAPDNPLGKYKRRLDIRDYPVRGINNMQLTSTIALAMPLRRMERPIQLPRMVGRNAKGPIAIDRAFLNIINRAAMGGTIKSASYFCMDFWNMRSMA